MTLPSALAALPTVFLLACTPASAAPAAAGTPTPHSSGDWGRDEAALRAPARFRDRPAQRRHRRLDDQKAAKERSATALRRSKCAAEGTSCQ